jgi:site-specific recombinase XerD
VPNESLAPLRSPGSTEILIGSVLATLPSEKTKQAYRTALDDFFACVAERNEPLSKPLLEAWRGALLARWLSVSSVNQRLSAVRLLFRQAAERGALSTEEALRLASVTNIKQAGQRLGKWLTEGEAGKLLSVPDAHTRLGLRDRAILALLVACGLRRDELARLEVRHVQLGDERWVLLDLQGKGRRVRTVPVPLWVKLIRSYYPRVYLRQFTLLKVTAVGLSRSSQHRCQI